MQQSRCTPQCHIELASVQWTTTKPNANHHTCCWTTPRLARNFTTCSATCCCKLWQPRCLNHLVARAITICDLVPVAQCPVQTAATDILPPCAAMQPAACCSCERDAYHSTNGSTARARETAGVPAHHVVRYHSTASSLQHKACLLQLRQLGQLLEALTETTIHSPAQPHHQGPGMLQAWCGDARIALPMLRHPGASSTRMQHIPSPAMHPCAATSAQVFVVLSSITIGKPA
jgi:hypothetical protein